MKLKSESAYDNVSTLINKSDLIVYCNNRDTMIREIVEILVINIDTPVKSLKLLQIVEGIFISITYINITFKHLFECIFNSIVRVFDDYSTPEIIKLSVNIYDTLYSNNIFEPSITSNKSKYISDKGVIKYSLSNTLTISKRYSPLICENIRLSLSINKSKPKVNEYANMIINKYTNTTLTIKCELNNDYSKILQSNSYNEIKFVPEFILKEVMDLEVPVKEIVPIVKNRSGRIINISDIMKAQNEYLNKINSLNINVKTLSIITLLNFKVWSPLIIDYRSRVYTIGAVNIQSSKIIRKCLKIDGDITQLDATASMFQIIAMVTHSSKLAKICNIYSSDNTDPYESLMSMCDLTYSGYKLDTFENEKFNSYTLKSVELCALNLIDRSIFKNIIMKHLYNSTAWAQIVELSESFIDPSISKIHAKIIYYTVMREISKILSYEFKVIGAIRNVMVTVHKSGNSYIYLPHMRSVYRHYKSTDIKVKLTNTTVSKKIRIEKLSSNKTLNSSIPNLIHSLDAYILSIILTKFYNDSKTVYTIHDCFITSKSNTEDLIKTYNKALYMVSQLDILKVINPYDMKLNSNDECIIRNIGKTLDMNKILNSKYSLQSDE